MNASASPAPKHDAAAASYSAAVMRSSELLSCAKSALKILLQQQPQQPSQQLQYTSPSKLHLFDSTSIPTDSPIQLLQHDCSTLLHQMHSQLTWLGSLVKRAGHSNDPTHDITTATQQLEAATQQLQALLQPHLSLTAVTQKQKHLHQMARQCQAVAAHYGQRLQAILKMRASVLSQQQKRRQQFSSAGSNTSAAAALNRNPLFAAKPLQATTPQTPYHPQPSGNGSIRPAAAANPYGISRTQNGGYGGGGTATASYYNSYGGGAGYGGGGSTMRRRPGAAGSGYHHTSQSQQPVMDQDQLLVQRQERQSAQRLRDARHTERALHQISSLFGKMSGLIQQQAEVLDKIEDDVEAASYDVKAGQDEITTLYTIKKGNRGLILKVFGLLIFLICFLRLYKK